MIMMVMTMKMMVMTMMVMVMVVIAEVSVSDMDLSIYSHVPAVAFVVRSGEDCFVVRTACVQASMPSFHVRLPVVPHSPSQLPPRAQQLSLPDFRVPHLGHITAGGFVVGC